jgi:hypothetical protein
MEDGTLEEGGKPRSRGWWEAEESRMRRVGSRGAADIVALGKTFSPCKISNLGRLMKWKRPNSSWLLAFPLFAARMVSLPLDKSEYLMNVIAASRWYCCSLEAESKEHPRPAEVVNIREGSGGDNVEVLQREGPCTVHSAPNPKKSSRAKNKERD